MKQFGNISTVQFSEGSGFISTDAGIDVAVASSNINLPSKVALAVGLSENKKWGAGAEFTRQQFSSYSNRFSDITSGRFENANRLAIGGYFVYKKLHG